MDFKSKLSSLSLYNLIMLTIAGFANAFGVTVFLAPVKLYDSGISGTSLLLSQLTPPLFSLSFFLIVLNVPLFLYGLKKQGFQISRMKNIVHTIDPSAFMTITEVADVFTSAHA